MSLMELLEATARLSNLQRYSMERLTAPESVLEHIGMAALFALVIASEINGRCPGSLDVGAVLTRAVVHDFDELITGDIPRSTKYSSGDALAMFRQLASDAVARLTTVEMASFPHFALEMRRSHEAAKSGDEGVVVALSDILCVVYKFWYEVCLHSNRSFQHKAADVVAQLEGMRAKVVGSDFDDDARRYLHAIINHGVATMGEVK